MRAAFRDVLLELMDRDPRVIFLTGDLGFGVFDKIIAKYPERYLNVGVAEAHLVDCAAGLALEGWRPLVYSIASFMTGRAFEQIRLSVGYHELPVIVVGAGGGYTYASSGVTHHAREDLALMRLIPGLTVVNPGDPNEVRELLPQLLNITGPSYIRIGRFGEPSLECETPIKLGAGRIVRPGKDIAILTSGDSVINAVKAWESLTEQGVAPLVCHFHTLEPFDYQTLDSITSNFKHLVVVEDHAPRGGLLDCVEHHLARSKHSPSIIRRGPDENLVLGNPSIELLRKWCGSDCAGILKACEEITK